MKSPRRLGDHPDSKVGALIEDARVTSVDPTPQAAQRVWAKLQEPAPQVGINWRLPVAAGAATLIALVVGLWSAASPDLHIQADKLLVNGQAAAGRISTGDRLTNTEPAVLRIDGWGEISLPAQSDIEVLDTEPMQFLLHKGTAILVGRSLTPLIVLAGTTRVNVRWATVRVESDGSVEAAEQDGDFSIHGAILPAPRIVTPSARLKKRQRDHRYQLPESKLSASGRAEAKSDPNSDATQAETNSDVDSAANQRAANSNVDSAANQRAANSNVDSAANQRATNSNVDSAAKQRATDSDVDSAANQRATNSNVDSAAKQRAANSNVDSAANQRAANSEVDSTANQSPANSEVDSDEATQGPRSWYRAARSSSDPEEALRLFDRVAETNNAWTELAVHQAIRNRMRRKKWKEATTRLKRARARFAGQQMQPELHLDAITCALALGNLTTARSEAQKFVDLYPDHPRVDEIRSHLKN